MSFAEAVRSAFASLAANRLRSGLTVLGVVIGVMSVVLLVGVGTGARDEVTAGVESLGSNLLFVVPGQFDFGSAPSVSRFTLADLDRLGARLRGRADVTGQLVSGERVRAGSEEAFVSIIGADETYRRVFDRESASGEFLNAGDVVTGRRVAVLGATAADGLFGAVDPIGQRITVAGLPFRVIGVLEEAGPSLGVDRDSVVLVPLTAAQRLFGTQRVDTIIVRAASPQATDALREEVTALLSRRIAEEDFSVVTQDEILGVVGTLLAQLTAVLAAIAGISLLVGGIGVSNIMLVGVSERRGEIGLRKALGARTRDITRQFLVEAVVLCGVGGAVGIALGIGFAELAAALTPLPARVTSWSVALAFGTSLTVGVVFGVAPARRAGRLDPVVALRAE